MSQSYALYQQRREVLAQAMRAKGGGLAIVATAPEVMRNRDADYPYRHDSSFYYLTGFTEPQSWLLIEARRDTPTRSILVCRNKDQEREIWDGFRYGPQAAAEQFGFDAAFSLDQLDQQVLSAIANQTAVFYALGSSAALDKKVRHWFTEIRMQSRSGIGAPQRSEDISVILDEMRLIKDAQEISIMRRAAQISAQAHCLAMQKSQPGQFEYEIEAHLLYEFRRHGSQFPAYGSIVASGANACILHYRENNAKMRDGDLLLIDAGCELDGYASDITRTFPVNGRFSGPQKALYEIVLASQYAAQELTRPGTPYLAPHDAAVRVLTQGMLDEGLLTGTLDGAIESGAYRRFYMHRTGHWLGMDVHDVGDYRRDHDLANSTTQASTERPWRPLAPGMVLTIEPGIYVRAASDIDPRYHDIGIRIEDDAVVTAGECEIITSGVPKTTAQIEALMAS